MSRSVRYPNDRFPKLIVRRLVRWFGFRVLRERSLPRGLDPLVDLLALPDFPRGGVAVDIGANVGQTVEFLLERRVFSRILACEPSPAAYLLLKNRYGGSSNVVLEQLALGPCAGYGRLKILGPTSERNHLLSLPTAGEASIDVRVDTLDNLAARHGIESIALLKIDTEGSELGVLEGARRLLESRRVEAILAECGMSPEDRSHTSFDDLCQVLRAFGLALLGLYDIHHEQRQIHYCNALFVRR